LAELAPFHLQARMEKKVTEKDVAGKIFVAEYFFYYLQKHMPDHECKHENSV
jgi:hypothetical protein